MWYFTLLLIFYVAYPLLEKLSPKQILHFTFAFVIGSYLISLYHNIGHALWITACGFIIGVLCGKNNFQISAKICQFASVCIFSLMLLVNLVLKNNQFNFLFILSFSIFFIYSTLDLKLNKFIISKVSFFSTCILEVYLLHHYFFIRDSDIIFVDFLLSLIVVLIISKIMSLLSGFVLVYFKRI